MKWVWNRENNESVWNREIIESVWTSMKPRNNCIPLWNDRNREIILYSLMERWISMKPRKNCISLWNDPTWLTKKKVSSLLSRTDRERLAYWADIERKTWSFSMVERKCKEKICNRNYIWKMRSVSNWTCRAYVFENKILNLH